MQEEVNWIVAMAEKGRKTVVTNQACTLDLVQRMRDADQELRHKLIAHRKWLVGLRRGTVKADLVK